MALAPEAADWLSTAVQLEILPVGSVVVDYEGNTYTKGNDVLGEFWRSSTGKHVHVYNDYNLATAFGPVYLAGQMEKPAAEQPDMLALADEPGRDYREWFEGLPPARQEVIRQDAARNNLVTDCVRRVIGDVRKQGMDGEQLTEVTELVREVLRNAHQIPEDQFAGHIALTLNRAGYHR